MNPFIFQYSVTKAFAGAAVGDIVVAVVSVGDDGIAASWTNRTQGGAEMKPSDKDRAKMTLIGHTATDQADIEALREFEPGA